MPDALELMISPADDGDSGWLGEDAIEYGTPPRPWAWQVPDLVSRFNLVPTRLLLVLLVVGLGIAVAVTAGHPGSVQAAPVVNTVVPDVPDSAIDPGQLALTTLIAEARASQPLADYSIEDNSRANCSSGASANLDPADTITATVSRYLPQYRLLDLSRGREMSGTCSVEARFVDNGGTVILATVLVPPNPVDPFVASTGNDHTSAVDVLAIVDGWRIEIGAVGRTGTLPSYIDLTNIATDARLRW